MKTKIVLTSVSALLLSVAGANALEFRPFIGATIGLNELVYSDAMDDYARASQIDLPEDLDFVAFGLEAGIRFGAHNQIYNGGFTLAVDTTSTSDVEEKFTDRKVADLSSSYFTATYDNYIRLSGDKLKRIDLIVGVGAGSMEYKMEYKDSGLSDDTIYSPIAVMKIGADFEVTKSLTLSATTRIFIPTRSHYDIETSYIFGGAVKYLF
jgi:hypothetical protein